MSRAAAVAGADVARAIHDVASPLTVLVGLCFALRRRVDDPSVIADLGRLEGEVGRISDRLDALLDLTRTGAAPAERAPLSMAAVARDVVERTEALAHQAGARIVAELGRDDLTLTGDASALEVALENLITNAIRHAGPEGTVWVSASRWGTQAVLHVADDGPGVHPDDRARIFRPNVRGRDVAGPGQGLGLAITRDTARSHGGDLILEASSRGAVFRLALPLSGGTLRRRESDAA
jgi:signal transduction histidine kinase